MNGSGFFETVKGHSPPNDNPLLSVMSILFAIDHIDIVTSQGKFSLFNV